MDTNDTKFHFMEIEEGDDGQCVLVLENDNVKEVQYTDSCHDEYAEEIINITNGETCRGCQTESWGYISTSFIVNIPVLFCSQPSPGVVSTQCNIPIMVDASVGTGGIDTCTQMIHERGDPYESSKGSSKISQDGTAKIPCRIGSSQTTGYDIIGKDSQFEPGKRDATSKRGRPRGNSRRGASFKYRRKSSKVYHKREKDSSENVALSSGSETLKIMGGRRRRTKKMYDDFEYDLGESGEELEIKLEVDDDDNDRDWKEEASEVGISDDDDGQEEEEEDMEGVDVKEVSHLDNRREEESGEEDDDENLDQLWRSKGDADQLDDLFSDTKEMVQVPGIKKEDLDEDLDYKSLIDAVVWKPELDGDNEEDLYGEDETGFIDKKQIQTVGVDDLVPENGEKLAERIKKYAEKSRMKYHREKVIKSDGKKVFKCLKCNKEFDKRFHLTEHRKAHARKLRIYDCNQCGKVFHEARKYFSHLSFHERIFDCKTCGRKFSLLANLKKHISIHQDAPGKVCEVCGSQFVSDDELKLHHEAQHSEDNVRTYTAKCEHCGREYRREEAYIQHRNRAPYNCPNCSKSFGCEYERKKHVRYEHDQCVCEFCGKSFKTNSILNHIKIMHREAHVQCPHCPKKFVYRSRMLAHIDSSHNAEKKYKCNQCPYSAKTVNSLNLHRRKCHLDPKKFPWYECNICNRKFYLPSKLTLHYRAHTGEKPFACQTCGKTFACKYNMKEHERAVHGERIEVKNPDGSTLVRLVKHRRAPRASGRRCDLCGIDFPSSTTIVEHMKKVHAPQSTEPVDEAANVKVSIKFEPQEEAGDKCLEYEVIGNAGDVILSDSSSMMNIRADEIPENATLVEIDGVEYQVVRQ